MKEIKQLLELERTKLNARKLAKVFENVSGIKTDNCLCTKWQRLQLWKEVQNWINKNE